MPHHQIPAIEFSGVDKSYGALRAVRNVSMKIMPGTFYSLIGPNGAGKSTIIKMMVGLSRQDRGTIKIFGHDTVTDSLYARRLMSYIPDDPTPYEYLTGLEFIMLTARLREIPPADAAEVCRGMAEAFHVADIIKQPISEYSRGSRQKVAYIAAMVGKPRVLIIDEPIVGLDPSSIKTFGSHLKDYVSKGGTVFMATHILSFASEWAKRVGVLDAGALLHERDITSRTNLESVYQSVTDHP